MNILLLCNNFTFGGMETHIYSYIDNMRTENFYLAAVNLGNDIIVNGKFKAIMKLDDVANKDKVTMNLLVKFVLENNIDVLHAHTLELYEVCYEVAKITNKKYVFTVHGPTTVNLLDSNNLTGRNKEIFYKSIANIAVSEETKNALTMKGIKSVVIRNGIDVTKFSYVKTDRNTSKYAIVSRISFDKIEGIKEALMILSKVNATQVDIYGWGAEGENLKSFVEKANFKFNVVFKGYCNDISNQISRDYFALFGMGRAILEGLAMGFMGILISSDKVKCVVKKEDLEKLHVYNFSGRGFKGQDINLILQDLKEAYSNYDKYILTEEINEKYNIINNIIEYRKLLET